MRALKIWKKTVGKLFTYLGLIMSVAGIEWLILELTILGIFTIIIGCLVHELNEGDETDIMTNERKPSFLRDAMWKEVKRLEEGVKKMKVIDVMCQVNSKEEKQKLEEYFAHANKLIPPYDIFYFMIKVSKSVRNK